MHVTNQQISCTFLPLNLVKNSLFGTLNIYKICIGRHINALPGQDRIEQIKVVQVKVMFLEIAVDNIGIEIQINEANILVQFKLHLVGFY